MSASCGDHDLLEFPGTPDFFKCLMLGPQTAKMTSSWRPKQDGWPVTSRQFDHKTVEKTSQLVGGYEMFVKRVCVRVFFLFLLRFREELDFEIRSHTRGPKENARRMTRSTE